MNVIRKAVLFYLPIILIVTCTAFLILQFGPGDPGKSFLLENETTPSAIGSDHADYLTNWKARHGLNLPVFYLSIKSSNEDPASIGHWFPTISIHGDNRFNRWLFGNTVDSKGVLLGDFGLSYRNQEPVFQIIKPRLINTFILAIISLMLALLIAIPSGLRAAERTDHLLNKASDTFALLILSTPTFWIATLLAMVFADERLLGWFPAPGSWPINNPSPIESIANWVLPIAASTIAPVAFMYRWTREKAAHELQKDYVQTARAKGSYRRLILYKHVLSNLLPELLSMLGQIIPVILSGSVLIETVFAFPGMGTTIFQAVTAKDLPVLSALFLIYVSLSLVSYFITDLIMIGIDPRRNNKRIVA